MSNKLEINTMAVVSTAHITENDVRVMEDMGGNVPFLIAEREDGRGFILYTNFDMDTDSVFDQFGFSDMLRSILDEVETPYIMLDADGPIYDRWEVYDW